MGFVKMTHWSGDMYRLKKKFLSDFVCCGGLNILLSRMYKFIVSNFYDFRFIDATTISFFFEFLISYFSGIFNSCFPPFY
jgi:pantothenate kinase